MFQEKLQRAIETRKKEKATKEEHQKELLRADKNFRGTIRGFKKYLRKELGGVGLVQVERDDCLDYFTFELYGKKFYVAIYYVPAYSFQRTANVLEAHKIIIQYGDMINGYCNDENTHSCTSITNEIFVDFSFHLFNYLVQEVEVEAYQLLQA